MRGGCAPSRYALPCLYNYQLTFPILDTFRFTGFIQFYCMAFGFESGGLGGNATGVLFVELSFTF